ncbi:hypothetical protein [Bradyrhizobium sp. CCBAU 45389]|uniref:hypothetical protein n=1 Tax=Bradyrhizobium sp. CCBAU 45389 TaxID=858429 RepID=UPI0023067B09|nr:hypothetical protein [Bradyrhizobium sp. CCBAU 45389]
MRDYRFFVVSRQLRAKPIHADVATAALDQIEKHVNPDLVGRCLFCALAET